MPAKNNILVKTLNGLNNWMLVWTGLGILVSVYALYIETKFEMNPEYVAACDINSIISCTKVLDSRFAKGFGLVAPLLGEESVLNQKNALYGLIVYFILSILSRSSSHSSIRLSQYIVYGITVGSIYLFAILLHLRAVCLVCYCTYFVNIGIFVNARRRVFTLDQIVLSESNNRKSK